MSLAGSLAFSGCKPNYETDFEEKHFEVVYQDRDPIELTAEGGERTIRVVSNIPVDRWTVEANCEWVQLTRSEGAIHVKVPSYEDFGTRQGMIHIAYGSKSYSIPVVQASPKKVIFELIGISDPKAIVKTFSAAGGEFGVKVRSNAPITDIVVPDSCAWMTLKEKKTLEEGYYSLLFSIAPSENVRPRYASAYLYTSADISKEQHFTIMQKNISFKKIPLSADMFYTNAQEPSEGPLANICDGDQGNYFHTNWHGPVDGGKPHYLRMSLKDAITTLKIEYSSRPNGDGGGDIKRADIYTSETGGTDDAEWTKVKTITFPLPGGRRQKSLCNELIRFKSPVKHIRLVPTARRNADPIKPNGDQAWFNMGEIYLWTVSE